MIETKEPCKVRWITKTFKELTLMELYAILQLRATVFVVEQQSVYQDPDGKDFASHHFMGWMNEELIAYSRLLPKGLSYPEPSIGRVVIAPGARAFGLGRTLMERSITTSRSLFGNHTIKISAQLYLKKFYASLGFLQCSEVYDEDGIPHVQMHSQPA